MDFRGWWAGLMAALPHDANEALVFGQSLLANPWARTLALVVIVYLTIRVIAGIYSGDKQGAELGPVAIRKHGSNRYDDRAIRLHRDLMPINMDGVSANCKVLYVFTDARGSRRSCVVHQENNIQLSISPQRIRRAEKIDGQEVPDVPTMHVCFPPFEADDPADPIIPMAERAPQYVRQHRILEKWHDDDDAPFVSVGTEFLEQIASGKEQYIFDEVAKIEKAQTGSFFKRLHFKRLRNNRPNVVGSYYLKFEFSHEPLFVLTRHPDRDLKMTAWLTILTSMFALIMDWWPNGAPPFGLSAPSEIVQANGERAPVRSVRVPVP